MFFKAQLITPYKNILLYLLRCISEEHLVRLYRILVHPYNYFEIGNADDEIFLYRKVL